jgi:probable addiction module antidote protein
MPKRTRDYREGLLESLTDPEEAARYIGAAMEDSTAMFLVALRDVADARQMSRVARGAGVAREGLYRMLSEGGNPTLANLTSILDTVGLRLSVEVKRERKIAVEESPQSHPHENDPV